VLALASSYSHLLFPATAAGKNVAPRVAAKLDVGQISDITKVDAPDAFERPIYAFTVHDSATTPCRHGQQACRRRIAAFNRDPAIGSVAR
jgi:electron transfer flavoprotein alpha subunit